MDRQQTTMSDSDVVHKATPRQTESRLMSDNDIVRIFPSFPPVPSERTYQWSESFGMIQRASALEQIKRRLSLISDNWDGHYAKAPHTEAINTTLVILDALLDVLPPNVPFPDVTPGTEGNVILELNSPDTEILLIIESAYQIETSIDIGGHRFEGPLESVKSRFASALVQIASSS